MSKNYKLIESELEKINYDKEFFTFHDKINEIITDFNEIRKDEEQTVPIVPIVPEVSKETIISEIYKSPDNKKSYYQPYYQPYYQLYYQPYYQLYYQPYFFIPYVSQYNPQMYIPFGQTFVIEKNRHYIRK